ncbi:MAG TPA: efflux RND transporter periplasmic adaptor subunit [Burkholderiales bacterium]|nr:efflux RND transporter periplasmic adaptor subunit [Burkholderiales bacterium]
MNKRFFEVTRGFAAAVAGLVVSSASAQGLETVEVRYRDVDMTYSVEAVVEAIRQSTVAARVTGRVVEVSYDVGEYVKQGQVIVRIDESEAKQIVAGSDAQVAQADAGYKNSKRRLERARELAAENFISKSALDNAEAEFRVEAARLKAAKAAQSQATTTRSYTVVEAPYSGVVSARLVEVGEMATPGKPLMTGFDPAAMRVLASVPQYKVAEVRASPRVSVEIPSLNRWLDGDEITVLPSADPRTHATSVRVNLSGDQQDLYPGMFARAHFTIGRARKLVLPAAAVVRRSEVAGVYVLGEDGRFRFRQLRLGEPAGQGLIEVLAGVMAGEQIALEPIKAGMLSRPE